MQADRPDWLTKLLTSLVSIAYFGLMALAALVLVATPILRMVVGDDPHWSWGLEVPAIAGSSTTISTAWGQAQLEIRKVHGILRMPIGTLPWGLVAILWLYAAAASALTLLALHHLRRLFQRVRDGAPFDAGNAQRLRSLGLSLLGLALLNGVAGLITTLVVRRGLPDAGISVPVAMPINGSLVFVALVLVTLARIFRRGSDLEQDQSLVI